MKLMIGLFIAMIAISACEPRKAESGGGLVRLAETENCIIYSLPGNFGGGSLYITESKFQNRPCGITR